MATQYLRVRKKIQKILAPGGHERKSFYEKKFYNLKKFGFKNRNALQLCKEAWRTCKLHMISKSQSVVAL